MTGEGIIGLLNSYYNMYNCSCSAEPERVLFEPVPELLGK